MKKIFVIILGLFACLSCQRNNSKTQADEKDSLQTSNYTSYAKGFRVEQREGWRLLEICDPQTESDTSPFQFALLEEGATQECCLYHNSSAEWFS